MIMNITAKRITKSIATGLLSSVLVFQGCGDYFDVGNNPNLVTEPSLNALLASVTHRTGMNAYRYGNAVANYVQYLASPSEGSSSDTYEITNLSTRSEEHTSELQSLMRTPYAVFCMKKKK